MSRGSYPSQSPSVFSRLRNKDLSAEEAPRALPHASARRHASAGRTIRNLNRRKREARNLVRSYVTCSSERHREIEREWDAADRANRRKSTQAEEEYLSERSARLWFDELPSKSIDSYVELWKAFLVYFLQQKKCIKDPVEIHHIKQREGESTEALMEHFKAKSMHVKGVPECMRVSGFMHEITNPDLIKQLNDNIPNSVDDMMNMTTTFLRGEVAVANQSRKKGPLSWRHHEAETTRENTQKLSRREKPPKRIRSCRYSWCSHGKRTREPDGDRSRDRRTPSSTACNCGTEGTRIPKDQAFPQCTWNDQVPAIQEEAAKLVEVKIMREVHYHSSLLNLVMVKKHDNSWRMCVDFTDLNNSCPKDCYPFLKIDWKVESLCGYPFKCFLDAYKRYHQIHMAEEDEEKSAFHTSQGVNCYTKMPFGLKKAKATYQRLVGKDFETQIGRNLKVYVERVDHLEESEMMLRESVSEDYKRFKNILQRF
ncbi:hypothetical protein Tco_0516076 [Tanacetum coccineum]